MMLSARSTAKSSRVYYYRPTTPRWRNWQTHYFEVVAGQPVQVQILSWALNEAIR
jgi:hypothetical protein